MESRAVVLLTEFFPPDHGGSAVLFGNVYSRLPHIPVTVISHSGGSLAGREGGGQLRSVKLPMSADDWGVRSVGSLLRYRRVIARVAAECRRQPSIVHCGRALPEGLAALGVSHLHASTRYICWTHGEELAYAASSRELTFLQRRVHKGAAAVVANCRNTARQLAAVDVRAEKIHVVYPGVDAERFAEPRGREAVRRRYAPDGEVLLVTVGRLQRRKGHDLAIQALAAAQRSLPPFRYLIVGDGTERARLEQLARDAGVEDRVVFVGAPPGDDLPGYYGAADVFIHPNRIDNGDVEGFGIVFLEAAAAGVPSIGGSSGGVPEAIEAGVTGLLVSGTDTMELADAIATLAASAPLRRRMGDAARARVRSQFTWERAAAQVADIQRQVSMQAATRPRG